MPDNFKFHYVKNGNTSGVFAVKGRVEDDGLYLGDQRVPFEAILDTTHRDARLVLTVDFNHPQFPEAVRAKADGHFLVLQTSGIAAKNLERIVDRHCSHREVEANRQALAAAGKSHLFRVVACPSCQASVDLSELEQSPYIYCRFCESIFGSGADRLRASNRYRECDACGYYDRVQGYGEFYFYFLLVVYGFSHTRRHLCDACGASLANKLLAINAIFLLGVPNALVCAVRARSGRDPEMSALSAANNLAKKGKLDQANEAYRRILDPLPEHPGVRYNQALAHLTQQQGEAGVDYLRKSLESCPNFQPAIELWRRLTSD